MKTFFIRLILSSLLSSGISLGLLLYSSYPLKSIATIAEKQGIHFEQLDGCLAKGIHFKSLSYKNQTIDIKISDFNIEYANLIENLIQRKLTIDQISIAKGDIHFIGNSLTKNNETQNNDAQSLSATKESAISDKTNAANLTESLKIKKPDLAVAAAQIATPKISSEQIKAYAFAFQEHFKNGDILKEYFINHLKITHLNLVTDQIPMPLDVTEMNVDNIRGGPKSVELGEIKLLSSILNLRGKGITIDEKSLDLKSPVSALVKSALWSELARDFDIKISGNYNFNSKTGSGEIYSFEDHAHIKVSPDLKIDIDIKNLTLADYIHLAPPITELTLHVEGATLEQLKQGKAAFQGGFQFASHLFKVAPPENADLSINEQLNPPLFQGQFEEMPFRYIAQIKPEIDFKFNKQMNWIFLKTNDRVSISELLSRLYFKKSVEKISSTENESIEKTKPQVTLGAVLLPLYTPPSRRVVVRTPVSSLRKPASNH